MKKIRDATGKNTLRKQTKIEFKNDPTRSDGTVIKGEFAYIHYDSTFEDGDRTELVVLRRESDGAWKCSGYAVNELPPPPPKEVAVSVDTLRAYVGKYRLKDGWEFAITLEGAQLYSQGAGQQKFPLFAESETKFFLKGVDARFEFVRDANGKVTTAILHQGGDWPGERE
jgi:hypothetical protein